MALNQLVNFLSGYISKYTGIQFREDNRFQLENRIHKLMNYLHCESPEQLHKMLTDKMTPELHVLVIDLATNNETSFFRDKKPFQVLSEVIVPELIKKRTNRELRIWSAGCSSGQEPYSIAMTLHECIPDIESWKVTIDATDISSQILKKAASGVYSQLDVQRGLSIDKLLKYFQPAGAETWQIKPQLQKMINFRTFNLYTDVYPYMVYDAIFCRNVLIYQDVTNKEQILNKISMALKPDGHLFMGAGESMLGLKAPFEQILVNSCVVFSRTAA